jgi:hypothetical protein
VIWVNLAPRPISPEPGRFASGVGYFVAQSVNSRASRASALDTTAASHFIARVGNGTSPDSDSQMFSDLIVSGINSLQLLPHHGGEFFCAVFWKPAGEPYLRCD